MRDFPSCTTVYVRMRTRPAHSHFILPSAAFSFPIRAAAPYEVVALHLRFGVVVEGAELVIIAQPIIDDHCSLTSVARFT